MKLLVFTQTIDKNDSVLGFFHDWVAKMSEKCESIEVICLSKGDFDLPKNVTVYSLGKEKGVSKLGYIKNLYSYLNLIKGSYDKVFVHMNQEYVLLAGIYWKIKRIPVYLWRNHPKGSLVTQMAVFLSKKVFCTSTASFTARFKKTIIMPAGINLEMFKPSEGIVRKKYSVCMVGRLSSIKHNELALEAINRLVKQGVQVSLSLVGGFLDRDKDFVDRLKKYVIDNNLGTVINFVGPKTLNDLPEIYSSHEICLNLTEAGSFDKTIVEGASCGAIPLVSSQSFSGLLPDICITENSANEIAESIKKLLDPAEQIKIQRDLQNFVQNQSLSTLVNKLFLEIQ
jgi:glycosyltransferase involved in cell wall biosynthesis